MTKCIVRSCRSSGGGDGGVTLHGFPGSLDLIKLWLQQTGNAFPDLDAVARSILYSRSGRYQICSRHFSSKCFVFNGTQMVLRPDAVPTVFQTRSADKAPTCQKRLEETEYSLQPVPPKPCVETPPSPPQLVRPRHPHMEEQEDAGTRWMSPGPTSMEARTNDKSVGTDPYNDLIESKIEKLLNKRLLNLAMEIISMLTGEEYQMVKKNPSSPGVKREVPVKCGDVSVFFSMEEWDYIEDHKDYYQQAMAQKRRNGCPPPAAEAEPITQHVAASEKSDNDQSKVDVSTNTCDDLFSPVLGNPETEFGTEEKHPEHEEPCKTNYCEISSDQEEDGIEESKSCGEEPYIMTCSPGDIAEEDNKPTAQDLQAEYDGEHFPSESPRQEMEVLAYSSTSDQCEEAAWSDYERFDGEGDYSSGEPDYASEEPKYVSEEPKYASEEPKYASEEPKYASAESSFPAGEPSYTTEEASYASGEPKYASGKSKCASAEPNYKSQEPMYASEEPNYPSGEPSYASGEPNYASGEPKYASEEPNYSSKKSKYASGKSKYASEKPNYRSGKSKYFSQEPNYSSRKSKYASEEPNYTSQEPTYASAEPNYTSQEPTYASAEPNYASGKSRYSSDQPNYISGEPSYASGDPSYASGEPSYTPGEPVQIKEEINQFNFCEEPTFIDPTPIPPSEERSQLFDTMNNLLIHQITFGQSSSSSDKPYPCSHCTKHFAKRSHLAMHLKTHSGERPYACPDCGKKFSRRSNMLTHYRTHTGEKPFACPKCGKRFTQSSHMVTHQKTHSGDKHFSCPECGKCFTKWSYLNFHLRTHGIHKLNVT